MKIRNFAKIKKNFRGRRPSAELVGNIKFVHGKFQEPEEHTKDGDMVDGEFIRSHGLHWATAALIIVGDIAGGQVILKLTFKFYKLFLFKKSVFFNRNLIIKTSN